MESKGRDSTRRNSFRDEGRREKNTKFSPILWGNYKWKEWV